MLFAMNKEGNLISAREAQKSEAYTCLECQTTLRVRGGFYKKPHFYHTTYNRKCRLSGKSLIHIQVQNYIKSILPEKECVIEHPFQEIGRIADTAWHTQKVIFEVQCSPISVEEVEARNRDYASIGYQVVWILHDKRYHRRRETAIEHYLKNHPHYYTNINSNGEGVIYDTLRVCDQYNVRSVLGPYPVDLSRLETCPQLQNTLAIPLKMRIKQWPFCFNGDLLSRAESATWDPPHLPYKHSRIEQWIGWLTLPYRIIFEILLEKSSR